jgi:DNA-binding NarL/FixJ family response regulator
MPPLAPLTILLADDEAKVRSAMQLLLEIQPGVLVAGEATTGEELLDQAGQCCPDAVLLDWELPWASPSSLLPCAGKAPGATLLHTLHRCCPHTRVIALSSRSEVRYQALAAGAFDFINKGSPPSHLLAVLRVLQITRAIRPNRCLQPPMAS